MLENLLEAMDLLMIETKLLTQNLPLLRAEVDIVSKQVIFFQLNKKRISDKSGAFYLVSLQEDCK